MNTTIDANPTKELFISLLTKDIGLSRAILDLIDNSVDAAMKNSRNESLKEYKIKITISPRHFLIKDNCGGMTLKDAIGYAFKFGRDNEAALSPHSIGRFGVGMKRTLFKLGKMITVQSNAEGDPHPFAVPINVDEWKAESKWEFQWEKCDSKTFDREYGVIVSVKNLYEYIKVEFSDASFIADLISHIKLAHFIAIKNDLCITVNEQQVQSDVSLVLYDDEKIKIKPQFITLNFSRVKTKIYCGLANRDKHKAGWYIFCNNRLIVEHDQSILTGWGRDLAQFHEDYALFRGYIFFDSEDPRDLPWTSTKTSLDRESLVFQQAYAHIIKSSKPVLATMREMATEKSWKSAEGQNDYLESTLAEAHLVQLSDVKANNSFECPSPEPPPSGQIYTSLTVRRPKKFINRLKREFGFDSNKSFAEHVFLNFLKRNGVSDGKD